MRIVNLIAFILTIIGGINWLCIGIFQFDFVAGLFGTQSAIGSRIIYILVGISALYLIYASLVGRGKVNICEEN